MTLFSLNAAAHAVEFRLELAPNTMSALETADREAAQAFLARVSGVLPPKFTRRIGRPVTVGFEKLSNQFDPASLCSSEPGSGAPERLMAYANIFTWNKNRGELVLERALLDEIRKGESASRDLGCRHGTVYRFAMAYLIHELAHAYDFTRPLDEAEAFQLERCRIGAESNSSACSEIQAIRGLISDHQPFKGLSLTYLTSRRTVDAYERSDRQEAFAVNMEYFLLDPRYGCRRPALYQFLSEHFGLSPHAGECGKGNSIYLQNTLARTELDPSRIYQVHYLLAGEGKEAASRWGHSMIRLIQCAPHRPVPGPDCLKDEKYHVVLGFRATSQTQRYDTWDGLTGRYPMELLAYRLSDILNEYGRIESRVLSSYPLQLTESERALYVKHLLEIYWEYGGRYYFFDNNCATATLHTLQSVFGPAHPLQNQQAVTPRGVFESLALSGLLRPETESRFDPPASKLEAAFAALSRYPKFPKTSYSDWESALVPSREAEIYAQVVTANPRDRSIISGHFFLLASRRLQLMRGELSDKVAEALLKDVHLSQRLQLNALFLDLRRERLISARGTYGIPANADLVSDDETKTRFGAAEKLWKETVSSISQQFPAEQFRIQQEQANLLTFGKGLSQ